jgi:outer membrane protein OmpU
MAVPAAAQDTEFGFAGFARMGGAYESATEEFSSEYRFQLDASFNIVSDAGLTFGGKARMRIDENTADAGFSTPQLFASTGDLTLSVGNIDGVMYKTPASYVGTGLDGNGSSGTTTYLDGFGAGKVFPMVEFSSSGAGAVDGVQLDYSMNGMSFTAFNTDDNSGVALSYSQDGLSLGVAYQITDVSGGTDATMTVVGASYAIDAVTLGASYAMWDAGDIAGATAFDANKGSVNVSYAINEATSVMAFFASEDNDSTAGNDGESYGFSISRGIGGGVTAVAGMEQNTDDETSISAGVKMSF